MKYFVSTLWKMFGFLLCMSQLNLATAQSAVAPERIGVYDSRAIAVAFAGSPAHQKQLQLLKAEHKKAKEMGDQAKVAQLEAEGKAMQDKAHKQAFSTMPVDDILEHITSQVSQVMQSQRLSAIVSKWQAEELKKYSGAEQVDVTMFLVDVLSPTDRQRNYAIEIQKHKPVPLEELRAK